MKKATSKATYTQVGIKHWDDIRFTAIAYQHRDYPDTHIRFKVYEITGTEITYGDGRHFDRGYGSNAAFVDISDAPVFIQGDIKWDGCSNWDTVDDDFNWHFCGREDAEAIGVLLGRLYGWAKDEFNMDRA